MVGAIHARQRDDLHLVGGAVEVGLLRRAGEVASAKLLGVPVLIHVVLGERADKHQLLDGSTTEGFGHLAVHPFPYVADVERADFAQVGEVASVETDVASGDFLGDDGVEAVEAIEGADACGVAYALEDKVAQATAGVVHLFGEDAADDVEVNLFGIHRGTEDGDVEVFGVELLKAV